MKRFANHNPSFFGVLAIVVLFLISSCTGSKYSSQEISEAENAIQKVEEIEGMDYNQSEFQEAQTKLEEARQMAEKGKHRKAALKADEAEAAAKLAEAKALSQKADESLNELTASIQSLKDRLEEYEQEEQEQE